MTKVMLTNLNSAKAKIKHRLEFSGKMVVECGKMEEFDENKLKPET